MSKTFCGKQQKKGLKNSNGIKSLILWKLFKEWWNKRARMNEKH